jgi:hypothetical protein
MKNQLFNRLLGVTLMLGLSLTVLTSCYGFDGIKGNGNVKKQERSVDSFDGIDVGGAFKVYLKQGSSQKVVVEADENLLDVISTEVRGSMLKIKTTEDIRDSEALNIYITFTDLKKLDVSGACDLETEDKIKIGDLEMDCSGASDVMLKMSAGEIDLDCSGASQMDLYGTAEYIKLNISGASNLDASDLEVKVLDADVSGASKAKVFVTGELMADVSGAASLKYHGDAVVKEHDVSGAGSMKKY